MLQNQSGRSYARSKFINEGYIINFVRLGKYQHSKTGKFYNVIGVARHSETLEDMVVYECLHDNPKSKLWVRPKSMFLEEVEIEGKLVPRFKFVDK